MRYPLITVYPKDVSADEAYNFVMAADMAFDDYKNATATGEFWAVDQSGVPPYDAPAHEGTIRYLKEKGIWTEEHQAWQDNRLARLNKYLDQWGEAQAEFHAWREAEAEKGNKVDPKDAWPDYWEEYRTKHN